MTAKHTKAPLAHAKKYAENRFRVDLAAFSGQKIRRIGAGNLTAKHTKAPLAHAKKDAGNMFRVDLAAFSGQKVRGIGAGHLTAKHAWLAILRYHAQALGTAIAKFTD